VRPAGSSARPAAASTTGRAPSVRRVSERRCCRQGASDKTSDNDSRQCQTEPDVPRLGYRSDVLCALLNRDPPEPGPGWQTASHKLHPSMALHSSSD
jgi:hypothetical protein